VVRQALSRIGAEYEQEKEKVLLQARLVEQTPSLLGAFLASYAGFETTITGAVARLTDSDPQRDVYPTLVAATTLATMRTALAIWCAGGGRAHLPTLLDQSFAMLTTGLRRPPAQQQNGPQAMTFPDAGGVSTPCTFPSTWGNTPSPGRRSGGSAPRRRGAPGATRRD
jgi:hypothetical protein